MLSRQSAKHARSSLPRFLNKDAGHWVVLRIQSVYLPAGLQHRRRQNGVVDIDTALGMPFAVVFSRLVYDLLIYRSGLELRQEQLCVRYFRRPHEKNNFRPLHSTNPQVHLLIVSESLK